VGGARAHLGALSVLRRGWLIGGLALIVLSAPVDLVASRSRGLRFAALPARMSSRLALWPLSGLALLALGWWERATAGAGARW